MDERMNADFCEFDHLCCQTFWKNFSSPKKYVSKKVKLIKYFLVIFKISSLTKKEWKKYDPMFDSKQSLPLVFSSSPAVDNICECGNVRRS